MRHDWKIRQLSQQLITQNNAIDTATGLLEGSLSLSAIKDIPHIVENSFVQIRQSLLSMSKQGKFNEEHTESLENRIAKAAEKIIKPSNEQ